MTPATATLTFKPKTMAIEPEKQDLEFAGITTLPVKNIRKSLNSDAQRFIASRKALAKMRFHLNRDNPATLCQIGDTHMLSGQAARATEAYLSALKIDETYLTAYIKVIDSMLLSGNLSGAHGQAVRGLTYFEGNEAIWSKLLIIESIGLFQGQTSITIDTLNDNFDKFLKVYPSNPTIIRQYGIVLALLSSDHQAAKQQFENALKLNINDVDASNNLALSLIELGRIDKALSLLKKAISVDRSYIIGYQNMMSIAINHHRPKIALDTLALAEEHAVDLPEQLRLLKGWLLLEAKNYKEAIVWHRSKLEAQPENDMLLNNIGFAYEKLKHYKKALNYYDKSVKIAVKNKITARGPMHQFLNLMVLAKALKKTAIVKTTAEALLNLSPGDPAALYFLGDDKFDRSTAIFAKSSLSKRLELYPHDLPTVANLSFILTGIDKNHAEAINLILSTPNYSDNITVLNNLAYSYIKIGAYESARFVLSKVPLADQESNPFIQATKGLLELRENHLTEAKSMYNQAIANLKSGKEYATQVWEYEQACYYLNKKDVKSAVKHLSQAINMGDCSYAYKDAVDLYQTLHD